MTLGVVDECRRMGLATKLLELTISYIQYTQPLCKLIYLHVITYNEAAIRFYERNDFV